MSARSIGDQQALISGSGYALRMMRLSQSRTKAAKIDTVIDLMNRSRRREGEKTGQVSGVGTAVLHAVRAALRRKEGKSVRRAHPGSRRLLKMALTDLQLIEQQIGELEQEIAGLLPEPSRCGRTIGGSPRSKGGFGATNHCRGGCQGSDLPFRQESGLVGRNMPGRRGERRRKALQTLPQAYSRWSIVVSCRVSDTSKRSEPLRIASVTRSGSSCTTALAMMSAVPPYAKRPSELAFRE
jgi:hypothetical protein